METVLLDRFRAIGAETPKNILGEGVAAVWDEAQEQLTCWRDQLGVRPFYFVHQPGRRFVFSSDLRTLTAHPQVPLELDLDYCRAVFEHAHRFQHPHRTLCAGVRKLEGGHLLQVSRRGLHMRRYWDPAEIRPRRYADAGEYLEELRTLLEGSIRCRVASPTHTAAAHLSGGLDSSSVAAIAHKAQVEKGKTLVAYSWAPPHDHLGAIERDERPLARAVADDHGLPLEFTTLDPQDFLAHETRDLPVQPSTTLQVELATSRAARQRGASIMLSGWGGDEFAVFNGRGYFGALTTRGRWKALLREMRLRGELHGDSVLVQLRSRALLPLVPDPLLGLLPRAGSRRGFAWPECLRPEFVHALERAERFEPASLRERPGVRRTQLELLRYGHLQYRTESWASHGADIGMTYAFPLLDRRIVEFALSVPDHLYFTNGWKRWMYRAAMQGVLPDRVRWNPHKFDNAMLAQLRANRARASDAFREQLMAHRDNPYIDVEKVGTAPPPGPDDPPRVPDAAATWLAFTKVLPA